MTWIFRNQVRKMSKHYLIPADIHTCTSISEALEMLLDCYCSEIKDSPYEKFCKQLGVDPNKITIREALAHAGVIKGIGGDVNALKMIAERTEGKPREAEIEENPLKQLTDDEIDGLIKSEQKLIEGGGDEQS